MAEGVFDVAVVGGGPGGYVAAIRARQLGLTTVLIEKDKLGGRCLNYACIPAKAVLRSADVLKEVQDAASFGVTLPAGAVGVDFGNVAKRRDRVVKTMTGGVGGLMKKHEVLVVEGEASFAAPTEAGVVDLHVQTAEGAKLVRTANAIIATGSIAQPVPVPGATFGGRIVDTAGAWLAAELPESLAVIGAGASGVEVASAYGRMGVPVTLIEALPQILPSEEPAIAELLTKELAKQNVTMLAGAQLTEVSQSDDAVQISVGGETLRVAQLCIAAGRAPDLAALNAPAYGVAVDETGRIQVGPDQRTSNQQIFAIGDVVPGPALAHKASEEAVVAVESLAGWQGVHPIDPNNIPRVTFCSPQVASIGLTEAQAHAAGVQVKLGEFPLAAAGAATVYGDRTGMIKIVGDGTTGQIVGAHAIGAKAGDLIAELAVAKSAGIGYPQLARIIHAHPTISEAVMETARAADGWAIHA
ncbi:MAG: dihydrolipoyl dehydrogenase [Thermoleophilaceae bacterium]|nr:dihydrolipoyl dehydrogenase [Thermoleophilaceae bacterium]